MRCLHALVMALLAPFLKICPNLMAPDIRFECTLHSFRLVPEYVFDQQRARCLEIAGTLLSPVLAVLHSTYLLQWEGKNFTRIGWRCCWFVGLLWRVCKSFQKSKRKRQCHLCLCPAAMSQWWCETTPTHRTSSTQTTQAPGFSSLWLFGAEWGACIHPGALSSPEPECWYKPPWDILVAAERRASLHYAWLWSQNWRAEVL